MSTKHILEAALATLCGEGSAGKQEVIAMVREALIESECDMVNHPPHYTKGGVECIDAIQSALSAEEFKGYCKAAAIKYLWRLDHKGSAKENAEKAIWYLTRLMQVL